MTRGDPVDQAVLRLESRRFLGRCEMQEALIHRADTLRELGRLALIPLPYKLAEDPFSRDGQRRVALAAENRAREIIQEQIERYMRAESDQAERQKHVLEEDWNNLTGALGHLRTWAHGRLLIAEQGR